MHVSSMPQIVNNEIRYSSAHRRYLPIYCEWIRATFFLVDFQQLLSIVVALKRADCANSQSIGNPAMFCTWLFVYLSAQVIGKHYAAGLMDGYGWARQPFACQVNGNRFHLFGLESFAAACATRVLCLVANEEIKVATCGKC